MGKATVDILLPNIDIDDPAMSTLKEKPWRLASSFAGDFATNFLVERDWASFCSREKAFARARETSEAGASATSLAVVSCIRAEVL